MFYLHFFEVQAFIPSFLHSPEQMAPRSFAPFRKHTHAPRLQLRPVFCHVWKAFLPPSNWDLAYEKKVQTDHFAYFKCMQVGEPQTS